MRAERYSRQERPALKPQTLKSFRAGGAPQKIVRAERGRLPARLAPVRVERSKIQQAERSLYDGAASAKTFSGGVL